MQEHKEVFFFAAKLGALEGYLFERRRVEPLDNWLGNISRIYQDLSPASKKKLAPDIVPVLERILEYGKRAFKPEQKGKLERMLRECSAGVDKVG